MLFLLRRPIDDAVRRLLVHQSDAALSYAAVGATRDGTPPSGWPWRRQAVRFGETDPSRAFEVARQALIDWRQYDLNWTSVPVKPPLDAGAVFATVARTAGLWSINCCRIVYVIDEPDRRFGYAIGTLPHHAETGEERFLLTRDGDRVQFEITSFSRPNHPLVRLGWRYAERAIGRFLREGTQRIRAEVDRAIATASQPVSFAARGLPSRGN